jgi:hypothetical protein
MLPLADRQKKPVLKTTWQKELKYCIFHTQADLGKI